LQHIERERKKEIIALATRHHCHAYLYCRQGLESQRTLTHAKDPGPFASPDFPPQRKADSAAFAFFSGAKINHRLTRGIKFMSHPFT
jgi:hypothetical protein